MAFWDKNEPVILKRDSSAAAQLAALESLRDIGTDTAASATSDTCASIPAAEMCCPRCGAPMVLRTAKRGERAGKRFYGCSTFPKCRAIINLDD